MKNLAILSIFALAAAPTLTAVAQMHPHHGDRSGMRLEAVDVDGDGNITLEEIESAHAERFDTADANGDGAVTLEEFKSAAEAARAERWAMRQERRFGKLDANGDGMISREEHGAHRQDRMTRMFDRIDSNDDGVISEAERDAVKAGRMAHGGKRGLRPSPE